MFCRNIKKIVHLLELLKGPRYRIFAGRALQICNPPLVLRCVFPPIAHPIASCPTIGSRVSQYLDLFINFVSSHGAVAYVVIFLCAFLEAVPLAGAIVPGSTVILALSALVPSGNLKLAPILIAAIAGAALGDGLAYWLGYTQKRRVLSLWPMSKYPALVAESERFFLRYGTFAVFFARFIPPIRAFVPITAGALDMPPLKFIVIEALAVLVWAPAMIQPGVLAGSAAEQWGAKAEHNALPLVCGLIVAEPVVWSLRSWWRARRLAQSTSPFK